MTIARELVTLIRYEVDASGLNKLPQTVSPGLDKVTDSANKGSSAVSRFGSILRAAVAGFGVMALTKMADEWAGVEARVGLVTNGVDEQRFALGKLYDVAQATGQQYESTAGLFQSVQRNAKELSLTLDDSLKLTDTIGKALTIGGGSKQSQQAALVQLGQALGSGTLRGEELNSVMEQAPRLAQAIAEAFNVPVGKLKDLGKAGKLTSKELAAGLLKNAGKLNDEFDRMPLTFSRAFTRLSNSLGQQVDRLNKASGAARIFYNVTSLVVDNLATIIKWVAYLGAAAGLTKLIYAARAAGGAVGALGAIIARMGGGYAVGLLIGTFIRMLAVVTAIYYVFDDIQVWFNGGQSLIGRVIGPMKEWKGIADGIVGALTTVKNLLGGAAQSVGEFSARWGIVGVVIFGIIRLIGGIPALIISGILAWVSVFRTNWSQLGDDIQYGVSMLGDYIKAEFKAAWDDVLNTARSTFASIGQIISDAIPDFIKNGFSASVNSARAGISNVQQVGQWAGVLPTRPGATAGNTSVEQNANVNIYTQSASPAAVADAARRGTEQGLGASLVPMVEAGP